MSIYHWKQEVGIAWTYTILGNRDYLNTIGAFLRDMFPGCIATGHYKNLLIVNHYHISQEDVIMIKVLVDIFPQL